MTALTVYGIPNCTTCKKARSWLDARGVEYVFVDTRATPRHWPSKVVRKRIDESAMNCPHCQSAKVYKDGSRQLQSGQRVRGYRCT
ncbi:MAG: glutaredoxin domain-containing protein, partial [Geitlerinemataceae cyanobacterium]